MVSKIIQVSDDSGSTFYSLPGKQGEFKDEVSVLDDTIFGQNFQSGQTNLISWSMVSNSYYKGFAGYLVDILKSGTPTTFSSEACSLVSGKTYKITDATKNVWDRNTALTISDGGGAIAASNISEIDYLFGRVTFISSFTPSGSVTASGKYLPMTVMASYKSFSLAQTCSSVDTTTIPSAQSNSAHKSYDYGLKTVSLDLSGVFAISNGFRDALIAGDELVVSINPDGSSKSVARGFFKYSNRDQSGNVGELEVENVSLVLTVPTTSKLSAPFSWKHTSSDLSTSIVKCLTAWEDETVLLARYLPNGEDGYQGDVIVTDISLSGGLEAMNEFSITLQGTGIVTDVTDNTV